MPPIIELQDLSDAALRPYAGLTEGQLRSRQKPEQGRFIAESQTVVSLALKGGVQPLSFLIEHSHLYGLAAELVAQIEREWPALPIYTASGEMLSALTGFSLCRGVMAEMKRPSQPEARSLLAGARRVAVLENIMDATNVGAIMRSAAALGMDALLVTPKCADPLLRRAARVSMGTVFQIPWTVIGERDTDWPQAGMDLLHEMGFATVAMALRHDTVSVEDPMLKNAERLAIVLGSEGHGLTEETLDSCDYTVKIPMYYGVDSLNVAAAAAIAFWEMTKRS